MPGPYDPTGPLGGAAEGGTGAWRDGADSLLHQGPGGFDRIEVVRVWQQEPYGGAGPFDQLTDLPRFVRGEIVHDHHVPGTQVPHKMRADPSPATTGVNCTGIVGDQSVESGHCGLGIGLRVRIP